MVLDKKFIIIMSIICGIYIVLSPVVFLIVNDSLHIMLGWNLLLALIPFLIAIIIDSKRNSKAWVLALLFLVWLLFFPNTFYMITDFIYIDYTKFMNSTGYLTLEYLQDPIAYLALIHIFLGAFLGVTLGYLCLHVVVESLLKPRFGNKFWLLLSAICFMSSIGIFIGRFFRYNSWDLIRVFAIIKDFITDFTWFNVLFILLFMLTQLFLYWLIKSLGTQIKKNS